MKMKRRSVLLLIVSLMVLSVSVGVSTAKGSFEGKKIAFAPKTLNNPYFVAVGEAIKSEAAKYGMTVVSAAPPAETDVDQQVSIVENYIQMKVDAILTVPCDKTALVKTINNADAAGIPVIIIDSGCNPCNYQSFVGTNNYQGGKLAAKWVGKNIVKGDVAILDGYSGNDATTLRFKGFMDQIKKYSKIKVVNSAYANCERAQGMTQAENFMTADPKLKCIFAVNDMMALGAVEAVKAARKQKKVKVIGFDGQPEAARSIHKGGLTATIAQFPKTMGIMAVDGLVKYWNGEKVEKVIDTGCKVVDKTNCTQFFQYN
jgi:ribose transport system substrate-binding protein